MEQSKTNRGEVLAMTAEIVGAHASNNSLDRRGLLDLIDGVFATLSGLTADGAADGTPTPAVPVKKSVTPDYLICLEDGRKLKMLKRHLMTAYGMTPEQYRAKWGLKPDYPMVAPNYSERRQALAKAIGLGRKPAPVAAGKVRAPRVRRPAA
jgi:predicted transcriptional regulator